MSEKGHLKRIVETILGAESFLLATHVFPDGDALGSMIGLGEILEALGKRVTLYSEDEVSYLYKFMPCCAKISSTIPDPEEVDCVIALDCGDQLRLGKASDKLLSMHPVVVLDHHAGHKDFGDLRWVDDTMPSTGNMVYELASLLGVELNYDAAFCLYTAIVSDTGSFKYASTTADTFRVAGDLVAKGVKPEEVSGKLFDNFTESRLHLLQHVLASLDLLEEGKIALITASSEMYKLTGAAPGDTETFINFPRSLALVKIAVIFKESDDTVSVSLRSKGSGYDVAAVARQFGGGGHRNAAGYKVVGKPDLLAVKADLTKALIQLVQDV